ncbi:MAG TPA: hypothetical protein VG939_07320 [Caulobacteraceae bacterium]|nr:hypothetical protein [Caulobacteraceae bacterium]
MVPVGGDAGHRRTYIAAGIAAAIVALAAIVASVWLIPREPDIAGYHHPSAPNHAYQAGGEGCIPARLRALPENANGQAERDRCAKAERDEQTTAESLDYNARSAHAAEQAVLVSHRQTIIMFWQTFATFGAFIAAIVAAIYAKIAADETGKSAVAAGETLRLSRRPRIRIWIVTGEFSARETKIDVHYMNIGEEVASVHRLDYKLFYRNHDTKKWVSRPVIIDIPGDANFIHRVESGGIDCQSLPAFPMPSDSIWRGVERGQTELCVVGHAKYDDRGQPKVTRRTHFIWSWDRTRNEFVRLDEPEWSFEN